MKRIKIYSQNELDNLPRSFEEYTILEIYGKNLILRGARGNSSVVARGNSSVEAWGNSSVEAWGNSSVVARGNSSVEARENSSVEAWESSSVEARENSSVEAWGNSSVVAWGNSSVVARGNSSVEAWGNSSVEAWESSSVEARGNSVIRVYKDFYGNINALKEYAVLIRQDNKRANPKEKDNSSSVVDTIKQSYNIENFTGIYKKNLTSNGKIILYKSVNPKDKTDFRTGTIKYEGEVICPDWDPDRNIQCGNGLHLSPTPELALSYNAGKLLICEALIEDIAVYRDDITKVRCKKVTVLEEYKTR